MKQQWRKVSLFFTITFAYKNYQHKIHSVLMNLGWSPLYRDLIDDPYDCMFKLTYCSRGTSKMVIGKQCRPRSMRRLIRVSTVCK